MAVTPLPSHSVDLDRRQRVDAARERWRRNLIDLTRRNPLLYYRPYKVGTLEFEDVDKSALNALLSGKSVSIRELFPPNQQQSALRKVNEIRKRAIANREDKGIETLFLTIGRVTWTPATAGRPPAAPILLLPIDIAITARGTEARLERVGNPRINAVLLYALSQEHGRSAALELQNEGDEEIESVMGYLKEVIIRIGAIARGIPGLRVDLPIVLGNFAFQKLGIVNDLLRYADQLTAHDVIAAISGDSGARQHIQNTRTPIEPHSLDRLSPDQEFLIRDADSSQQRVIAAVLAGQSGVIQGPPGTGKSQTIANLIATLAAHGKRVLFVAEKQAALDVVYRRLKEVRLGHLALNLHDGTMSHRTILDQLRLSLAETRRVLPVNSRYVHQQFSERRSQLNQHVAQLHMLRLPSGLSAYGLHGELLRIPPTAHSQTRWRNPELAHITVDRAREIRSLLLEASGLSALFLFRHPSPWTYARLTDSTEVQDALDLVEQLFRNRLPRLIAATSNAANIADLPPPVTVGQILILLDLLPYIATTLNDYEPTLFDEDLIGLVDHLSPAGEGRLRALWDLIINGEYRHAYQKARKHAKRRGIIWPWTIHNAINEAAPYQQQWLETLGDEAFVPEQAQVAAVHNALQRSGAEEAYEDLLELAALFPATLLQRRCRTDQLDTARFTYLQSFFEVLRADTETPYQVPRVRAIRGALQQLRATPFFQELRERQPAPEHWASIFEHAWLTSCLQQAQRDVPSLVTFNGATHERVVDEFRQADQDRVRMAADRVRRSHAEHVRDARNTHSDQDAQVRQEIEKKRGHLSMRRLVSRASDVLTAICPCWMASPLTVSQFIPGDKCYFDVVVFDEASQVLPEDAIAALLRGSAVVVAGDKHQLPPTRFFAGADTDVGDEDQEAPEQGYESLLDLMGTFLDPWPLLWHYRSRDESLIAFANRQIYDNDLITFPSPNSSRAVNHDLIPFTPNPADNHEESNAAEVDRVIQLIFDHAENRPRQSLGVITLGITHMQRLQAALDKARQDRSDLDDFFREDRSDHFFIKNLERVQGDERDAIILSIGCTKNRAGRLNYTVFGPLLREGGERRLNVAITRARLRMTITSSFDQTDMPPGRSRARGVELLREYLAYASESGKQPQSPVGNDTNLDAFEVDVYQVLRAHGMRLEPQVGASDARITFAVGHPDRPDEFVLAIETDGPTYHTAATASERDRLRQQQLESLGWAYHRIWSLDWYQRREQTIARVMASYAEAIQAADARQYADDANAKPEAMPAREPDLDEESSDKSAPAREPRPDIPRGQPIGYYVQTQLVALVRWINSDGLMRTDEEVMEELRADLGFQRVGSRMREVFQTAIDLDRRQQKRYNK
jgi:hypothetical protein